MSIEQVRFLGASITGWNSVIGWNGQSTTVTASLVEDLVGGDAFLPPLVGSPVLFEYEGFKFGGILQNITAHGSGGGNPLYEVTMTDPRQLLGGVKVILDGYIGSVLGVPNIVNIYGYYESNGFGTSGSNGGGMTWAKIRDALNDTVAVGTTSGYGGPIQYMGHKYGLDLSNLPELPAYYRISGTPSLMEIIQNVCDASGCDYFVELIGNNITFFVIDRKNIPDQGVIARFIEQTPGAISKQIGFDMVNEVTGKFVVGGKKREVYYQYYGKGDDGDEKTGFDNPIWWFWGYDNDGNVILGNGLSNTLTDGHVFTLDSRDVLINGVGATYPTSIGEMRAAIAGREEWEQFLRANNNNKYIVDVTGRSKAELVPISRADFEIYNANTDRPMYRHSGVLNPHFGKAYSIGIMDDNNAAAFMYLTNKQINAGHVNWGRLRMTFPGKIDDETSNLYDFVRSVAEENYGTKILVSLPHISAAFDTETNRPIFSTLPCDGGYLDESLLQGAAQAKLIPLDLNAITDDMNLIKPMVRFDNIGTLDFQAIPDDQMFFSADGMSIFIICSIESEVLFLDWAGLQQPRVVVRLPGRVTFANTQYSSQTADVIYLKALYNNNGKDVTDRRFLELLSSQFPPLPGYQFAALPALAAVPLESQTDRYGPWFAQGAIGAMEFEENDSLTPWNYGTYSNLQLAGEALVEANISNLQTIESGTIEFPDLPNQNLGSQLLSTGPYISNITVDISSGGIKTIYQMATWKPKFGALNRTIADTVGKMGKLYNMYRRNFLQQIKINRKVK